MYKQILLLLATLLLLGACDNTEPVTIDEETGLIDLASLPEDINVQTAAEIQDLEDVFMIDVREQWEYDEGHIPNITLIPLSEIEQRLAEVPTDKTVVVTCRSGNRSSQVLSYLKQQGYDNVHNMQGGILAWERAGYDVER